MEARFAGDRQTPRRAPGFAAALVLLSIWMLAGCTAVPGPPAAPPADEETLALLDPNAAGFDRSSVVVDPGALFELDEGMRRFAQTELKRAIRESGPEQGLVDALYRRDALQLHYDPHLTRSAAQTFAARRGNCLSLVIMTAAFARHLGLDVEFRAAQIDPSWSRRGGLYLASGHVNITVGRRPNERSGVGRRDAARLTVDFLPPEDLLGLRTRPITEDELVAMYLNNRAVEALGDGALNDAHAWAAAAVRAAPRQADAWNTLGAVLRRHAQAAKAILAFRAALQLAPEHVSAMANLARTLEGEGQTEEAARWSRRLAALEAHPPFEDLRRGWAAISQRDWRAAQQFFERELGRSGPAPDLHHGLAIAAQQLGEHQEARRQLAAALQASSEPSERQRFLAKFEGMAGGARVR